MDDIQLHCNLCSEIYPMRVEEKTEELWLRTIRNRDYLVCENHRGNYATKEYQVVRDGDGVSN